MDMLEVDMKWILGIVIVLACLPAIVLGIAKTGRKLKERRRLMRAYRMMNHIGKSEDIL